MWSRACRQEVGGSRKHFTCLDEGPWAARTAASDAGPDSNDSNVLKGQIRDLREQLRQSEIDKDILKKAAAFFAREQP